MIVCDRASSNLTMIKATHGHFGTYPILSGKNIPILIYILPIITIEKEDPYEVSPYILNPFHPPNLIYWLIIMSNASSMQNFIVFLSSNISLRI